MPSSTSCPADPQPLAVSQRIDRIDAWRGVALLGIVLANVRQLLLPWGIGEFPVRLDGSTLAAWLDWALYDAFIDLKFLTLFSLLFGISFALQAERLAARWPGLTAIYLRRVLILGLLGIAHGVLLYPAEVLLAYAAGGALLLALRRLGPETLIRVGLVLLGTSMIWGYQIGVVGRLSASITAGTATLLVLAVVLLPQRGWTVVLLACAGIVGGAAALLTMQYCCSTPGELASGYREARSQLAAIVRGDLANAPQEYSVRASGGFLALVRHHADLYLQVLLYFAIFLLWRTLGLFMIGAGLFRLGVLTDDAPQRWPRIARIGLGIGLPLTVVATALHARDVVGLADARWPEFLHALAVPPLIAGIAATVAVVQPRPAQRWLWRRIEASGRMALTNYVGHSFVLSLLAESWGLGLYARLDGPQMTVLATIVFGVFAELSYRWLRRYRMGPLEWLWRCGTYARWLPNR